MNPGVFHRLGKAVALLRAGGGAPMFADLPQIFAADGFVAVPALGAAEPAALVAEKFYLVLFGLGERIQGIEGLVQPEVRHDIPELRPPDLCLKRLKICQDLGGGGYEIKLRVMLLQVVQKQLGVDDDPILHSAPLGKLLTHCVAFPV